MVSEDPDTVILDEHYLFRGVPPVQWNFEKGRPGTFCLNTDKRLGLAV